MNSNLTWSDFFSLRTQAKRVGRYFGIPFAASFLLAESILLSQPIFDPTMTIFGLDPFVVLSLSTIVGTSLSFFTGSFLGRALWHMRRPHIKDWMNQRQRDFYSRIVQYRANIPPVPTQPNLNTDFHGEKIASITDYRHWLRRQTHYKPIFK